MFSTLLASGATDAVFFTNGTHTYSREVIIKAAASLSHRLPPQPQVINLFNDRHAFMVVLLAVGMRSGTLLLPASHTQHAMDTMLSAYAKAPVWVASESRIFDRPGVLWLDSDDIYAALNSAVACPDTSIVPVFDLTSDVVMFTSGSTGTPKAVRKTWHTMAVLGRAALQRLGWQASPPWVVATVPQQHMYGFEATMLWPLLSGARVFNARPLFPEDIQSAVNEAQRLSQGLMQREVWLVSTPLHLQKLLDYGVTFNVPKLTILSATAPLSVDLAKALAQRFNARVVEIYGSTETASLATREPANTPFWTLYDHYQLFEQAGLFSLHIPDLALTLPLHDTLRCVDERRFELLGRQTDLVKVAGKRASLADLNAALLGVEGVEDGCFWYDSASDRMQAVVVSQLDSATLRARLVPLMDAVFLPRRCYFVAALPRNATGKLPQQAVTELIARLQEAS